MRAGGISVETDHIFPIIKKWLYSDKDIFLREIVSNAADAITKMKRLCSLGQAEADGEDYKILVRVDKTAKTLVVEDNGIGMTEDELTRYICQIALSGALEFIEKYEGTPTEGSADSGIIGHFGLGFYSAFMVSEKVEIITKSYTGAPALRWVCSDNGSYEIYDSDSESRGTSVIMHIADEEAAYLEAAKVREILDKYCAFMPYEIYLETGEEDEKAEKKPINTTSPLWLKRPNECTEEEYNEFYHKVFGDFRDPLFSIHINADYPFNFKGILYFPRLRTEFDNLEGRIKLYYNQVFVADNVKEVVPEYLFMLRGVIDCPELPLNVSRSYLQNNVYVSKVSAHIVKKICDKLGSLCQNNRAEYEKIWGDIRVFVEFASVSDRKFFDRVKDSLLLGLTDKTFVTINEYREAALKDAAGDDKEKAEVTVYYTSDPAQQSQYISMFTAQGYKVAVLDHPIDTQFITSAERVYEGLKFVRVDADISALASGADEKEKENKEIVKLFRKAAGDDKLNVKFVSLKDNRAPTLLNLPEDKRRMDDFMKQYSFVTKTEAGPALADTTLVVNTSSPAYTRLLELVSADVEKAEFLAGYIYKLSLMAHRRLDGEELSAFLSDSYDIICGI
ncbi:MAG TPA: molecular chaperone HtpG [Clostridiales bacterium]|nr:molecular chaperone HtpG [Clostridiales bacterium]